MPKKYKIFQVSIDWLKDCLIAGTECRFKMVEGIPEDSRVVDFQRNADMNSDLLDLLIFSETFDVVEEGKPIPRVDTLTAETIL